MIKISRFSIGLILIWGVASSLFAQQEANEKENPLNFVGTYTGDAVSNLSGGIKTGTAYLGFSRIQVYFDTQKAKLWKSGLFHIHFSNTHGDTPTENLVGDIQGFSNIEAGNHTFLQELWYKQQIKNIGLTVGLQDMNVEFAGSEHGAHFLNSSFGVHSTIAENISTPIFPLTSPGITIHWVINQTLHWKNALYDGEPLTFDKNPYNLIWNLNKKDGFLYFSEIQKDIIWKKNLAGSYRLGSYMHEHIEDNGVNAATSQIKYGFYMVADQMVWKKPNTDGGLGLFAQFSYSPQKILDNFLYVGGGVNLYGIGKRKNDVLGIAVAYADFRKNNKRETVVEGSYKAQMNKNFYLQPDFQYIIHPSGTDQSIDHATVATLRFGLDF